jgi:hypothetical protein
MNDPFVGGLRSLDGAMDNPYHGQERDDGQSSRCAKLRYFRADLAASASDSATAGL